MKEVKRGSNNNFYLSVLELLKQGKNPSAISKELSTSKQKVNYYIRQLKNEGVIQKKGYGTWEVKQVKISGSNTLSQIKEIRGHAFIWNLKIKKGLNLKEKLINSNLEYKKVSRGQLRLFINNKKVWIGNKTITVFEHLSFYGRNSIESRKYAVVALLEVIHALENKLNINLSPYGIKPKREHYGMIRNDLAIQCNRNNEKIVIRDDKEGEWLWIDDSLGIGELETGGTKALVRSKQVQDWWNDKKENGFKVTDTFIMNSLAGLIQVQQMNADNIIKHQKVLDEMLLTLKLIQNDLKKRTI